MQVVMLLYPRFQQLDLTGPFEVFARFEELNLHLVWKTLDPVNDVNGLRILPTDTLAGSPQADILFVPGGPGQISLMEDKEVLSFLRRQASGARYVTSVCTGSLAATVPAAETMRPAARQDNEAERTVARAAGTAAQPPMADMGRSGCRKDGSLMPWPGQLDGDRRAPAVGELGVGRAGAQRRRAGRSRSGRTGSCAPGRRRSAGPGRRSPQNGRVTDAITPTRAGPPSTRNASAGAEPRSFGSSGVRRELAAERGRGSPPRSPSRRASSRAARPAASAR